MFIKQHWTVRIITYRPLVPFAAVLIKKSVTLLDGGLKELHPLLDPRIDVCNELRYQPNKLSSHNPTSATIYPYARTVLTKGESD